MLHYNDLVASDERTEAEELSMGEMRRIVHILNNLDLPAPQQQLFQRLIYQVENLEYFRDRTVGLWATEFPESVIVPNNNVKAVIDGDVIPYLFELKYRPNYHK